MKWRQLRSVAIHEGKTKSCIIECNVQTKNERRSVKTPFTEKLQWNKLNEEKGRDEREFYNILGIIGVGSISTISMIKKKTTSRKERNSNYIFLPKMPLFRNKEKALYALKEVDLSSERSKQNLDELRNEIDILKSLDHPNILKAFETFDKNDSISIVLELCNGGDLRSRQPYTEKEATIIINKITSAVAYMHGNNIVHRDLKLENIMFESNHRDAEIKIIDFGLSRKINDHDQVMKGQTGSVYTMAPEVIKKKYTIKADIWSVGVLSFMLLSGNEPFPGKSRKEIESKILEGEYNFDDVKWKNISEEAKDFVSSLIEYDPDKRVTAREAQEVGWLKDKFLLDYDEKQNRMMEKICHNLMKYSCDTDFKKLALNIIAHKEIIVHNVSNLRQAFDHFDSNGDGTIKYLEFEKFLSKFHYTRKDIEKSFHSVNLNNNGEIWYTEFVAATIESQGHIKQARLEEAFERLDCDKTGYITKDNLCRLLGTSCSESLAEKLVKEADSDGDGRISYSDFSNQFRCHDTK